MCLVAIWLHITRSISHVPCNVSQLRKPAQSGHLSYYVFPSMHYQAHSVFSALFTFRRTSIACIRKDTLRCRSYHTSMADDNTDGKKIAMSKRGGSVWEYMVQHSLRGNQHLAKLEEVRCAAHLASSTPVNMAMHHRGANLSIHHVRVHAQCSYCIVTLVTNTSVFGCTGHHAAPASGDVLAA